MHPISTKNAEHFKWGQDCSGWWLKKNGHFTVIFETMPPGTSEVKHYHSKTEQFFYCLQGRLTMVFEQKQSILNAHEGITVEPDVAHKVQNQSNQVVHFLVISSPNIDHDRTELE